MSCACSKLISASLHFNSFSRLREYLMNPWKFLLRCLCTDVFICIYIQCRYELWICARVGHWGLVLNCNWWEDLIYDSAFFYSWKRSGISIEKVWPVSTSLCFYFYLFICYLFFYGLNKHARLRWCSSDEAKCNHCANISPRAPWLATN